MPKSIGIIFYVQQPTSISGKPIRKNIVNSLDLQGGLLGLERISSEDNVSYKARLYDASVHPSGPSYEGIINDLGRLFGYIRQNALTISLKMDSVGSPIATSPCVELLSNRIILYNDWTPFGDKTIDKEIRIYKLGDIGYYLDKLVAAINESEYFSADIYAGCRSNLISNQLIRCTSSKYVSSDSIRADNMIQLSNKIIIRDSLSFIERNIFSTETSPLQSDGDYSVDYVNGEIYSYSRPSGQSYCSYYYGDFPFTIEYSPIQVFSFQDDDFQYELFNRKILNSGEDIASLLNSEGSEIYHQLFKETNVFWGP